MLVKELENKINKEYEHNEYWLDKEKEYDLSRNLEWIVTDCR